MASTSNIPEDVLLEILLRLPVKSLVQFRCVSKSWLALLKSPDFIDMHLKFSLARDDENLLITRFLKEENKNLLSVHSNDESLSVLVPNLELHGHSDEPLCFVGSCDGIVCLTTFRDIILFNPSNRESRTLPRLPCPVGCHIIRQGKGFGFDQVSNDYKVVQIIAIDDNIRSYPYSCKAEIYNLSTDTWRELDEVLPQIMSNVDRSFDLFFNGRIHWRAVDYIDNYEFILAIDISTEVFYKFRIPEVEKTIVDEDAGDNTSLLVIKDSLALILYTTRFPRAHPYEQMINIWLMIEYGVEESWSKQYSIGPLSGILRPLSVWKIKHLLLERVWNRPGEEGGCGYDYCELVAWDALKNEEVQRYAVYGFEYTIGVVIYKETLLSITRT